MSDNKLVHGPYDPKEREILNKAMPEGLVLWYLPRKQHFIISIDGSPKANYIKFVHRDTVKKFRNPERVLNYIARRALLDNKAADLMKRSTPD